MGTFTFTLQGNFLATKAFSFKVRSDEEALAAFNQLDFATLDAAPWCIDALTLDDVEVCDEEEGDSYAIDMDEHEDANAAFENTEPWEIRYTDDRLKLHQILAACQAGHCDEHPRDATKSFFVSDIVWDTDSETPDLPRETTVRCESSDDIADVLSETHGWLVSDFRFEPM
ncbi:hypothetical protein [Lysobacter capsici]|uniref:hypothetical protein n=1 Tax=Lysobacter capsici TaxID=435897 RepID=UPI001C001A5D|nr:hypothetical protein [Lysobacter capsici]QWF19950.1 hypothetical protein KME82_05185 [Lysobacter capsici]